MSEPIDTELRADLEHRRRSDRQFILLAFATSPPFMALALVSFSPIPVVGWVLYVIGVLACAILIARATGWLRADDPRLRRLALITLVYCLGSPVISILGILFIEP